MRHTTHCFFFNRATIAMGHIGHNQTNSLLLMDYKDTISILLQQQEREHLLQVAFSNNVDQYRLLTEENGLEPNLDQGCTYHDQINKH